jgi:hypothetical protein
LASSSCVQPSSRLRCLISAPSVMHSGIPWPLVNHSLTSVIAGRRSAIPCARRQPCRTKYWSDLLHEACLNDT